MQNFRWIAADMRLSSTVLVCLIEWCLAQPLNHTTELSAQQSLDWNPKYEYSSFSFKPNPTSVYAQSNERTNVTKYYAPHYTEVATLLGNVSTKTWRGSWRPNATITATDTKDPYGEYAWQKMWELASIKNFTSTGLYSTTVKPTVVPTSSLVLPPEDPFKFDDTLKFPSSFIFGVAGSAAQIEGAIAEKGRTPSIQEKLVNLSKPKNYVTNENYYLYKQDISRIAAMGVKYYSFTIPWSRILPFVVEGTPVNQEGIDHYDDLIDTCLEYGITPIATLTHFDSPLMFNEGHLIKDSIFGYYNGGYDNTTFVDAFVNYGKVVLTHYADRVPIWIGFNEPFLYSGNPVGVKNVVLATARLHKFYHNDLKATGKFGIKFNDNFGVPKDPANDEDVKAAERFQEFQIACFANPLFLGKDSPASWRATFGGSKNSTSINFSEAELQEVKFGSDFLGIDPYTYTIITPPKGGIEACQKNNTHPLWPFCVEQSQERADGWAIGYRSQSYVYITPEQLRVFLSYLWNTFKAPVLVSEFGYPEWREREKKLKDQLFDTARSIYYRSFMEAIAQAINLDKVNVIGALAWSFADNWEFGDYEQQFGLQVVNRTTQERFYKKSFFDLVKYVNDRS